MSRAGPDVAFICTARASYTRNETLLAALQRNYPTRPIVSDLGTYPQRLLSVVPRALAPLVRADIAVAGFLAQPLAPLFHLRAPERPLVVDAFISLHETLCEDRRSVARRGPVAAIAKLLDAVSMRRAHTVLTDTAANADDLARRYGIDRAKFAPVYVGANETLFHPRPVVLDSETFRVFYYATFLPLHGVDTIIRAAHILRAKPSIHIEIVGDGPERPRVERLAQELGVSNVTFHDAVPYHKLPELIAQADVCLGGHFNAQSAKAQRVVPGKVFQFLAMAKPTVAGDCAGTREALADGEDALFVPMGDAAALAEAVLRLQRDADLRQHIALGGLARFRRDFSLEATAARLKGIIDSLARGGKSYADAA